MWKGIRELVDLLLLWGFWYLGSFKLMVVAIFYFIQSNKQSIIKQYYIQNTVQVIEPSKRVLVEQEVCNMISGLTILVSTFVFAGCPFFKKKELSPPPPESVMEKSSEQPSGVRIIVVPP